MYNLHKSNKQTMRSAPYKVTKNPLFTHHSHHIRESLGVLKSYSKVRSVEVGSWDNSAQIPVIQLHRHYPLHRLDPSNNPQMYLRRLHPRVLRCSGVDSFLDSSVSFESIVSPRSYMPGLFLARQLLAANPI